MSERAGARCCRAEYEKGRMTVVEAAVVERRASERREIISRCGLSDCVRAGFGHCELSGAPVAESEVNTGEKLISRIGSAENSRSSSDSREVGKLG